MSFEEELKELRRIGRHGRFEYKEGQFKSAVTKEFGAIPSKKWGIYIVREKRTNSVLYVGKGGTISRKDSTKRQDIPGRLKAPRKKGNIGFEKWLFDEIREMNSPQKYPFEIEYIILPNEAEVSPAYAEARLLQAYFQDKGKLPVANRAF